MQNFRSLMLFTLLSVTAFAQQDAQFSQNMFNKLTFNPAFAGMNHGQCGTLFYRDQWVGFTGAPTTTLFNLNIFSPAMKGGIGLTAMEDRLGNDRTFASGISASHHFNLLRGELSVGAKGGLIQKSFINNWVATDGVSGDNSIPVNGNAMSYLDMSAGAFYLDINENYLGLSVTNAYSIGSANASFKNVPHYYLTAGTNINLPFARNVSLKPSLLVKSDGVQTIFDLNALAFINNKFWVGGSYRMTDAVVLLAGIMIGPLKIGYSYDITTSEIKDHSSNTHEFMISFCHKITGKRPPTTHISPRHMELKPHPQCDYPVSKCNLYNAMHGDVNSVQ